MNRPGLILFILLSAFSGVKAQKSFMDEISIPYLDTLIKVAKENYPRVKTNNQQIRIAENNLKKSKLSWFDLLGLYYFYTPQRTNPDIANPYFLNGFQVGVSFNVGSFLQKSSNIKTSKGELAIAQNEKIEYDLNLEANVKNRYYLYIQKLSLLKLRTQAVLDAQSTLASVRIKFERGQESLENYNKLLSELNEENREKIIVESEVLTAKAFLEELLNKKLEEIEIK